MTGARGAEEGTRKREQKAAVKHWEKIRFSQAAFLYKDLANFLAVVSRQNERQNAQTGQRFSKSVQSRPLRRKARITYLSLRNMYQAK
ncbi:protein of unknown function [Pararobbsia alpina]